MPVIPPPPKCRGSSLAGDQILGIHEYLISPNGRFLAFLRGNGVFGVYWNWTDAGDDPFPPSPFPRLPCDPLWTTDQASSDDVYFLAMQTDGNLVIYQGVNFQNRGPVLWANDRASSKGGTYVLNLRDDGSLRVTRNGEPGWGTTTNVIEYEFATVVSKVADGSTYKVLSSYPPVTIEKGLQAVVEGAGVSVTDLPFKDGRWPATADQLWKRFDWYDGGNFRGCVLINQLRNEALVYHDKDQTLGFSSRITSEAIWTFGDKETFGYKDPSEWRAIRPSANETVNLNVKGDPPGCEVIVWRWTGPANNLVWTFFGAYPVPASPAAMVS